MLKFGVDRWNGLVTIDVVCFINLVEIQNWTFLLNPSAPDFNFTIFQRSFNCIFNRINIFHDVFFSTYFAF